MSNVSTISMSGDQLAELLGCKGKLDQINTIMTGLDGKQSTFIIWSLVTIHANLTKLALERILEKGKTPAIEIFETADAILDARERLQSIMNHIVHDAIRRRDADIQKTPQEQTR